MAEKINFKINDGDKEWNGRLKINELHEHFCTAELDSRDSKFNIVLSCYFDKFNMQEWCMTVPDWDFGCKLSQLEQCWNEEQIGKYITNKVDRKSLASGVTELFRVIEEYRMSREEAERNQEEDRDRNESHKKQAMGKAR